jgi:chromosomal replication initiator protein
MAKSTMDREEFRQEILKELKKEVSERDFYSFFNDLELVKLTGDNIVIEFPNNFVKEWIQENHADILARTIARISDHPLKLKTRISKKRKPFIKKTPPPPVNSNNTSRNQPFPDNLKSEFTFDNFVVGPPNQFSHAAALAVAKQPGTSYNPLFIYSVPGLGKTHLLNAIGNHIRKHHPKNRICYITSEDFTNEMVDSLMEKKMTEFRNKYRQVDTLLIDDIQFIAGKESTEEEFFHTFNTLEQNQKQIVMTCDQLPNEIPKLEDRLRSRFQMGLIADIQPPDKETLVAILLTKAGQEEIPLNKEVAFFLADHLSHKLDIRRIMGALTNIALRASVQGKKSIDVAFARQSLEEINIISWERNRVSVEEIIKTVAEHFRLSSKEILSRRRTRNVVFPRQIAMYLARVITDESFPEIGEKFGGKDHATVMHACKKIEKEIGLNKKTANLIEGLKESLSSVS